MSKTFFATVLLILHGLTVVGPQSQAAGEYQDASLAQLPAQQTFDPFPGGIATRYHFDLARNFFQSPDEEAAARRLLISRLEQFQRVASTLPRSPAELLRTFQTED